MMDNSFSRYLLDILNTIVLPWSPPQPAITYLMRWVEKKEGVLLIFDGSTWPTGSLQHGYSLLSDALKDAPYPFHIILSVKDNTTPVPPLRTAQPSHAMAAPRQDKKKKNEIPFQGARMVLAVASGKGGVGKSTTTLQLGFALAKRGLKVGLLDADIQGPSLARGTGLLGRKAYSDGRMLLPFSVQGLSMMSMGCILDARAAAMWRGPMLHHALHQLVHKVAWDDLDILLVDMPPGTGDIPLSLAQLLTLDGIIMVTTSQQVALDDVERCFGLWKQLKIPVIGIVETMGSLWCPTTGTEVVLFGHSGAKELAKRHSVPLIVSIPFNHAIVEALDAGKPLEDQIASYYHSLAQWVSDFYSNIKAGDAPKAE